MDNEIISYFEMCQREGSSLQRGMNFELGGGHSVILMSVRSNAPYVDRFEGDGSTIIYEGHDTPHSKACPDPKALDQPEFTPSGTLAENGKFLRAALAFKKGLEPRHSVKCVPCGATDELHFDHDLPYSLGGTSIRAENVQLLCARHNLSKGAKIR
jgi:hypothetical protein